MTAWLGRAAIRTADGHQRTPGHSLPGDGTVPARQVAAAVGARAARSASTTASTSSSSGPLTATSGATLRRDSDLPRDKFLVVLSSRISHEKDPETVLRAVALARARGLDAVAAEPRRRLSRVPRAAGTPGHRGRASIGCWPARRCTRWRELADYFRAADVLALASLAEGCGYSPLEALACETPVVATAVGGHGRRNSRRMPR